MKLDDQEFTVEEILILAIGLALFVRCAAWLVLAR